MLKTKPHFMKVVGALAMVIALLCAGLLISHQSQGHGAATSVTHVSAQPVVPANGVLTDAWFNEICIGIIFLALLTGTRFRLANNRRSKFASTSIFRRQISSSGTRLNLNLSLTQPQLGVFRI